MKKKIDENMPLWYCRRDGDDITDSLDECENCPDIIKNFVEVEEDEKED